MKIFEKISEKDVVLVSIDSKKYNDLLIGLLGEIKNKKVCMVTTNKGYHALVEMLRKKKISEKNFYFIDCVTKAITTPKPEKNCTFLSSPQAINEIALAVSNAIKNGFDFMVIDSLSTLLVYHSDKDLTHFIHNIINKVKDRNKAKLIMTISEKDEGTYLFSKISVMSDCVINLR